MVNVIDNSKLYVEVRRDFTANLVEGGEAFWARPPEEISVRHPDLMIVKYEYSHPWPSQEMHPNSDEIITVMEGEVDFILNPGQEEERVRVRAGETVIVPAGTWHTAEVSGRAVAQHILMGQGTQAKVL